MPAALRLLHFDATSRCRHVAFSIKMLPPLLLRYWWAATFSLFSHMPFSTLDAMSMLILMILPLLRHAAFAMICRFSCHWDVTYAITCQLLITFRWLRLRLSLARRSITFWLTFLICDILMLLSSITPYCFLSCRHIAAYYWWYLRHCHFLRRFRCHYADCCLISRHYCRHYAIDADAFRRAIYAIIIIFRHFDIAVDSFRLLSFRFSAAADIFSPPLRFTISFSSTDDAYAGYFRCLSALFHAIMPSPLIFFRRYCRCLIFSPPFSPLFHAYLRHDAPIWCFFTCFFAAIWCWFDADAADCASSSLRFFFSFFRRFFDILLRFAIFRWFTHFMLWFSLRRFIFRCFFITPCRRLFSPCRAMIMHAALAFRCFLDYAAAFHIFDIAALLIDAADELLYYAVTLITIILFRLRYIYFHCLFPPIFRHYASPLLDASPWHDLLSGFSPFAFSLRHC